MAKLWKRIKRRILMTITNFRNDCCFSLKLAAYRMIGDLCGRFGLRKIAKFFHQEKDEWIMAFLKRKLQNVLDSYKADEDFGEAQENAPIWICWWTGEETAPALVKQCIRSIRANAGNHPVNLVTQYNYKEYLVIPDYMLKKASEGKMCFAHLADYIRVALLAQRGGLWLDATIFCSAAVPDMCFDIPFFTCKSPRQKCGYLSEMRWVTFCLGGWKGNVFFRFLSDAFEHYWQTAPCAVDYLFFDHVIELAYRDVPAIRQLIDAVPENNLHRDDLQAAMNAALPASEFESVLDSDTVLYKLSWRETDTETALEGNGSIYHYFLTKAF